MFLNFLFVECKYNFFFAFLQKFGTLTFQIEIIFTYAYNFLLFIIDNKKRHSVEYLKKIHINLNWKHLSFYFMIIKVNSIILLT